mgnify:CR=1 FL=1
MLFRSIIEGIKSKTKNGASARKHAAPPSHANKDNNISIRNILLKEKLDRLRETTRNLTKLLAGKEEELRQVNRKCSFDDTVRRAAVNRADLLMGLHGAALQKLAETRNEVDRLKHIDHSSQSKLAHSERRLRIQENILSGAQNLISSLSTTITND